MAGSRLISTISARRPTKSATRAGGPATSRSRSTASPARDAKRTKRGGPRKSAATSPSTTRPAKAGAIRSGGTTMPYQAVLLDVDGTLVDSNAAHAHAWVEALAASGRRVDFLRVRPLVGMGSD